VFQKCSEFGILIISYFVNIRRCIGGHGPQCPLPLPATPMESNLRPVDRESDATILSAGLTRSLNLRGPDQDCWTLYIIGWGVGVARDSSVALDYTD